MLCGREKQQPSGRFVRSRGVSLFGARKHCNARSNNSNFYYKSVW